MRRYLEKFVGNITVEKKRYLFDEKNQYVLFSGTANGQGDELRHLNDLYFYLFLLKNKAVPKEHIILAIDIDILEQLRSDTRYVDKATVIQNNVGSIVDITEFEENFSRDKKKDLIFIASGHGSINGLYIEKNNSYLSSDYFENIATYKKRTILVMSQCFAGAFHHLDTRKNICVLGASEYQESLSVPIEKLVNNGIISSADKESIFRSLVFYERIPINPFLFSIFIYILYEEQLLTQKKNLLNIYKYSVALMYAYLKQPYIALDIEAITSQPSATSKSHIILSNKFHYYQKPYLLNKIIATRFFLHD